MIKQGVAVLLVVFSFSFSALAGNNPRIDQALMESLAQKKSLKAELSQTAVPAKTQVNSRYRAVEILEVGDELGGFANSKGPAEEIE